VVAWEKVKETYRLGLKHGMKLATISGVNGVYTPDDIDRIRALALAARDSEASGPPGRTPATGGTASHTGGGGGEHARTSTAANRAPAEATS
jgi:hypothetical protein